MEKGEKVGEFGVIGWFGWRKRRVEVIVGSVAVEPSFCPQDGGTGFVSDGKPNGSGDRSGGNGGLLREVRGGGGKNEAQQHKRGGGATGHWPRRLPPKRRKKRMA